MDDLYSEDLRITDVLGGGYFIKSKDRILAIVPNLGDRSAERRIAALIKAAPKMSDALSAIVGNASMIPDPRMDGATDVSVVPFDDIDAASAVLDEARSDVAT